MRVFSTAWKVSKYGVFSGPYFPTFGLNTKRYVFSPNAGKIRTIKYYIFGHLSHSVDQQIKNFLSQVTT